MVLRGSMVEPEFPLHPGAPPHSSARSFLKSSGPRRSILWLVQLHLLVQVLLLVGPPFPLLIPILSPGIRMAMYTLLRCCLCSLALLVPTTSVLGYQQPQRRPQIQRREAFGRLVLGSGLAGLVQLGAGPTPPAHAIIGSKGCYQGQGEACTELAGENDLIKSLQEKSSANRAKNEKVCQATRTLVRRRETK